MPWPFPSSSPQCCTAGETSRLRPSFVRIFMRLGDSLRDGLHFRCGLAFVRAGFQSRENSKEPRRPRRRTQIVWRKRKRNPKSSLKVPEAKGAGHDPGNSVVLTVDLNEVAEHARVAAKPSLPQLVAQDDRVIASPLVLFGQEGSPHRRTNAQNLEKVTRDPGACHALWRRAAAYCEIFEIRRGHAVEGLVLSSPVKIIGR